MTERSLTIFVDVDDTFVRSFGTKRIGMPAVVAHIKSLHADGATLYCWSSGGAQYARESAEEFGIAECFTAFLPKPEIVLDDVRVADWRRLGEVQPNECVAMSRDDYRAKLAAR